MSLPALLSGLSFFAPCHDDDPVDRLHYFYTSTALMVSASFVALKIFGGRPLECWTPAEYPSSWQTYAGAC